MNIVTHETPFPWLEIHNLYTKDEMETIRSELKFLSKGEKLLPPEQTGTATDDDGNPIKNNRGVFLDDIYGQHRRFSDILQINRKVFSSLSDTGLWFYDNFVPESKSDSTLISYYENYDHYKPHRDESVVTVLTWFFDTPKSFIGGDLYFPDYDIGFMIEDGISIAFPSSIRHEVIPIIMEESELNQQKGRYCLSMFINM
jgi:hypothetical protein